MECGSVSPPPLPSKLSGLMKNRDFWYHGHDDDDTRIVTKTAMTEAKTTIFDRDYNNHKDDHVYIFFKCIKKKQGC